MRALVALACSLVLLLVALRAACSPHVVVLEPKQPEIEAWPQGQRAMIAELSASGLDVLLRQSQSADVAQLTEELLEVAREPDALGALTVARQGLFGLVLVVTSHSGLVRLEVAATGAIAESRAALLVAELLRRLQVPAEEPAPQPLAIRQPKPASDESTRPRRIQELWVDGGVALSSDLASPLLMLGVAGSLRVWNYVRIEVSGRLTPMPTRIDTAAGSLELRAAQATFHAAFSPATPRGFGFALGLGGGALMIDESARGAPGFVGRGDRTLVALLSARARAFAHAGPVLISLMVEPGLTLPPITVRAEGSELARFGRPWTCVALGLGFEL
jgi:hypothetical protein